MAGQTFKLKENAPGNFFVNSTCIDCRACIRFAPTVFGETGKFAYVKKQPQTEPETLAANRGLLSCPTRSIGTEQNVDLIPAINSFPQELAPHIYINGFNARESGGNDSYFIESEEGNWLVDCPRFNHHLVKQFKKMGGIKYIFLTHQDEVANARLYAGHFGSKRIIHRLDAPSQTDAEIIVEDDSGFKLDKGQAVFMPGGTRGHQVFLWDNTYIFTGDYFGRVEPVQSIHFLWGRGLGSPEETDGIG